MAVASKAAVSTKAHAAAADPRGATLGVPGLAAARTRLASIGLAGASLLV